MKDLTLKTDKVCIWLYRGQCFSIEASVVKGACGVTGCSKENRVISASNIYGLELTYPDIYICDYDLKINSDEELKNQKNFNLIVIELQQKQLGLKIDKFIYFGELRGYSHESKNPEPITVDINEVLSNYSEYHQAVSSVDGSDMPVAEIKAPIKVDGARENRLESDDSGQNFILFRGETKNFYFSIENLKYIIPAKDLKKISLVSDKALGYVQSKDETIPVVTYKDAPLSIDGKILIMRSQQSSYGLPVSDISELVNENSIKMESSNATQAIYQNQNWEKFDLVQFEKSMNINSIYEGYQKIFPNLSSVESSNTVQASKMEVLLLVELGERVCIPVGIIQRIDTLDSEFFSKENQTYKFHDQVIPVFKARDIYGFSPSCSENEKVLVLFKGNQYAAVVVDRVNTLIRVDLGTEIKFGDWVFKDYPENFKNDVNGFAHYLDYDRNKSHTLLVTNFNSLFSQIQRSHKKVI